jgi:hypothetical protein
VPESARSEAGGLSVNDIASLTSLVADIAARGNLRRGGENGAQEG